MFREEVRFRIADALEGDALRIQTTLDGWEDPRVRYVSRRTGGSQTWNFGDLEVEFASVAGAVALCVRRKASVAAVAPQQRAAA